MSQPWYLHHLQVITVNVTLHAELHAGPMISPELTIKLYLEYRSNSTASHEPIPMTIEQKWSGLSSHGPTSL